MEVCVAWCIHIWEASEGKQFVGRFSLSTYRVHCLSLKAPSHTPTHTALLSSRYLHNLLKRIYINWGNCSNVCLNMNGRLPLVYYSWVYSSGSYFPLDMFFWVNCFGWFIFLLHMTFIAAICPFCKRERENNIKIEKKVFMRTRLCACMCVCVRKTEGKRFWSSKKKREQ